VAEVDSTLLMKIQQSTFYWQKEEIAVTDPGNHLIYKINLQYLNDKTIRQNMTNDSINHFKIAEKDGVCYKYAFKNQTFHVLVMAYDNSRNENLKDLRGILIWSTIFSIWVAVLLSYLFSKIAIKPISEIIKQVKKISYSELDTRLSEGNKKDEIAQLAITFNEMLSELEIAFKNQTDFVAHASHELRTPLTIMISESDFLLGHEQSMEEYKKHVSGMVVDLKELNRQLNTLLELAQINKRQVVQFSEVRIDEIIFSAIKSVKANYPGRKIIPKIQYPENENELLVNGNYGMLVIALRNLLDNACKFSHDDVTVDITMVNESVQVNIMDKGIGIPQDELDNIFQPFNRASNVKFIGGFGIGLSLVARILDLHNTVVRVYSTINEGTRFELWFKRLDFKSSQAKNTSLVKEA
jgi:signal transduction histidine kinase